MTGRNMNVYFREETYSKIKSLISSREISRFINEAVEEKLQRKQEENEQQLKQQLIKGYQDRAKREKLQEMLQVYGEIS
jgi:hydrogenase maturation factor HypE